MERVQSVDLSQKEELKSKNWFGKLSSSMQMENNTQNSSKVSIFSSVDKYPMCSALEF